MRNYRVRVRGEKADFFEELLKHLDFCDFEKVDDLSDAGVYSGFDVRPGDHKVQGKIKTESPGHFYNNTGDNLNNLREVMSRIDAQRDRYRKD